MDVRKFWLTNSLGGTYELTNPDKPHFLGDPSGLGLTINYSSIKLSNSELINSKDYVLGSINGDLMFYADTRPQKYQDYFNFLNFISKPPIYMHYLTPNNNEAYRCLVQITGLEKTEVQTDSILHCPVSFKMQTVWYSNYVNNRTITAETENAKMYQLQRPYAYGVSSFSNVLVNNGGNIETPFSFEVIAGESETVNDFEFSISQNDVVYGVGKILGSYNYIYINSDDLDEEIILKQGTSVIPNAINYQDLSIGSPKEKYITFIKLKTGQSRINFRVGDGFTGVVKVSWRNAYLSV